MYISFFNKHDAVIADPNISCEGFIDLIDNISDFRYDGSGKESFVDTNNDNLYFNLCRYQNITRRHEDIISQSGLILDYDSGISIDDIRNEFQKYKYFIFPSPRYLSDGKIEKFRMVLPFENDIQFDEIVNRKAALKSFFATADPTCFNRGQIQGVPRQLESNKFSWFSHTNNVDLCFDPLSLEIEQLAPTKPDKKIKESGVSQNQAVRWLNMIDPTITRDQRLPIDKILMLTFGDAIINDILNHWEYTSGTSRSARIKALVELKTQSSSKDIRYVEWCAIEYGSHTRKSTTQIIGKGMSKKRQTMKNGKKQEDGAFETNVSAITQKSTQEWDSTSNRGIPHDSIKNITILLQNEGIKVRYNQMTKKTDIDIPSMAYQTVDQNIHITDIIDRAKSHGMNYSLIPQILDHISGRHTYHPVVEWIAAGGKWDGKDRFTTLLNSIVVDGDTQIELRNIYLTRWFMGICHAMLSAKNGYTAQGMLVFSGAQGIGKTTWLENLLPLKLRAIKTGANLSLGNKDSVIGVIRNLIVEIGELDATFRKSDISALKAFITERDDTLRLPYAKVESSLPRQTAFFGTVNDSDFLIDTTGNRRYWVLDVKKINRLKTFNFHQCWKQMMSMYESGTQWEMTSEEHVLVNKNNVDFERVSPIEDQLLSMFKVGDTMHLTATEVCVLLGYELPTKSQKNDCSAALRRNGFRGSQSQKNGIRKKGWHLTDHIVGDIIPKKYKYKDKFKHKYE